MCFRVILFGIRHSCQWCQHSKLHRCQRELQNNFSFPQPFIFYFTCLTFICSFPATSLLGAPPWPCVCRYILPISVLPMIPYLFCNQRLSRCCFHRQSEEDLVLSLFLYLYIRLQKYILSPFFFLSLQWWSSFTPLTAPVYNPCWTQCDPSHLLDWHVEPS